MRSFSCSNSCCTDTKFNISSAHAHGGNVLFFKKWSAHAYVHLCVCARPALQC
jgi:hypothetical protein